MLGPSRGMLPSPLRGGPQAAGAGEGVAVPSLSGGSQTLAVACSVAQAGPGILAAEGMNPAVESCRKKPSLDRLCFRGGKPSHHGSEALGPRRVSLGSPAHRLPP